VFSRVSGRLLTGPIAFALGGMLDIGAFAYATVRARIQRARR
jgi:hypothetical protein